MLKLGRRTRELMIKELTAQFKENNVVIVANFRNIDVNKIQKLKKPLLLSSTRFRVVKNSMARIAAKNSAMDFMAPFFEGTCGVGFCSGDVVATSKIFVNFAKENENFKIRGASIAGEFISYDKIKELAVLPSREVLLAMTVRGIKAPISNFVGVLSNVAGSFVRVMDQIAKTRKNPE